MNKLLILYPEQFNCFSKFKRKISRITENMGAYSVVYPKDSNLLISQYFDKENSNIILDKKENFDFNDITHAIIFDDGEEFKDETEKLKNLGIPFRNIGIKITRVINIKNDTTYGKKKSTELYEYIGRGSYWGNPYSMYENGDDREEVIRKFKYDFEFEKFINKDKSEVYKLAGKRLGCFCKPLGCHGDVLAEYLNQWDDGK